MTGSQWLVLGGFALLVFWVVGAYNRLVSLRHRVARAGAQLDEPLRRRAAAWPPRLAACREQHPESAAVCDAVAGALQQVQVAADALRVRPANAAAATALATAEGVLGTALARLQAAWPQTEDEAAQRERQDAELRLDLARQAYNEAIDRHDAAVRQFPTRLVAGLFHFEPGARL